MVDRAVTVQFFRIEPNIEGCLPFERAMAAALALGEAPATREKTVQGGAIVRLERLAEDGNYLEGEFARIQKEGLPRASGDTGLAPLAHDAIGHAVAFRYRPDLRILALQMDKNAVSLRRIFQYLRSIHNEASYSSDAVANEDVWERFERGQPIKFSVAIAAPTNLQAVEGGPGSITSSAKRIAEATHGASVRIEVSAARGTASLDKNMIRGLLNYFTGADADEAGVTSLAISSREGDERADDLINFVDDLLKSKRQLALLPGDVEAHYAERREFVRASFDENLPYIQRYYGIADN
jgi:hypothetical protein